MHEQTTTEFTMLFQKATIMAIALLSSMLFAQDRDYSGAELYTNSTYMYGKFEARMYMAAGSGLVSSMFLYYNDSYLGNGEPWVEIDTEILGKAPESFQSNIISGSLSNKVTSEKIHTLTPAANAAYHTYGFEWTPTYVAWFIDGNIIRKTKTDSSDTKNQVSALTKEQSLRFNLWSSTAADWVGPWDDAILPVHQYINWVKVYSYTPGTGENGSDFTLNWTDDFDSFDNSRWNCGDWTFDQNRVKMSPDNVNVQNGTLILSITKAGLEGFTGTVPVDEGMSAIAPKTPKARIFKNEENVKTFDLNGRYKGLKKK